MSNLFKKLLSKFIPCIEQDCQLCKCSNPGSGQIINSDTPYQPFANGLVDIFAPCDGIVVDQKEIPNFKFSAVSAGVGIGFKPTRTCEIKAFMNGDYMDHPKHPNKTYIFNPTFNVMVYLCAGIEEDENPPYDADYELLLSHGRVVVGDSLSKIDIDDLQKKYKSTICSILVRPSSLENRKVVVRAVAGTKVKEGDLLFSIVEKDSDKI